MSATAPIVSVRTAANRRTARNSTGPKTPAGKARPRANALKHGLIAAGLALSTEDAALVAAELEAAQEDFAPTTRLGAKLVRRDAILSIRLDRCERHVQAADEQRIRHAVARLDSTRAEHADRLLDAIEADHRTYRRALLVSPEGSTAWPRLNWPCSNPIAQPSWPAATSRPPPASGPAPSATSNSPNPSPPPSRRPRPLPSPPPQILIRTLTPSTRSGRWLRLAKPSPGPRLPGRSGRGRHAPRPVGERCRARRDHSGHCM